jgi:hypothetical protein
MTDFSPNEIASLFVCRPSEPEKGVRNRFLQRRALI